MVSSKEQVRVEEANTKAVKTTLTECFETVEVHVNCLDLLQIVGQLCTFIVKRHLQEGDSQLIRVIHLRRREEAQGVRACDSQDRLEASATEGNN